MSKESLNESRREFEKACDEHVARYGRNAKVYISGPMSGLDREQYLELAQPDMIYYIVVTKEDEAKVKEAMKHYPEIEVAGYAEWFMHIVAVPGEVKFIGAKKTPPILWEACRYSAISAYLNRPIY